MRTIDSKGHLKVFLIWGAVIIVIGFLAYAQWVVQKLREDGIRVSRTYAKLWSMAVSEGATDREVSLIFEEIIQKANFPIILTDPQGQPKFWRGVGIPWRNSSPEDLEKLKRLVRQMDSAHPPIPVSIEEMHLGELHYGDSWVVNQLRWMPFVEVGVVGLFLLMGLIGYRNIKRNEQKSIWVGMAKETAHQLGTPISSLWGWLELLKGEEEGAPPVSEIIREMEGDVGRLSRIASRFGQIGFLPELKTTEVLPILKDIVVYFRNRLSQKVEIVEDYGPLGSVRGNRELLFWAVENLVKNSLDSLKGKGGKITISARREKGRVLIRVKDEGKGIPSKLQRKAFSPGFTTKKGGWGLGLALAQRIVEEYHKGRISLVQSSPQGSTFEISLITEGNG